jgi:thiosulfate dehydrogenase
MRKSLVAMIGLAVIVAACETTRTRLPGEGEEASIARGGRLYDKWYKVIEVSAPKASHPLYPADKEYADKPGSNWRCKECHGWDYKGKDGAYGSGKHHTGIKGINAMVGTDPAKIVALLKAPEHDYGDKLSAQDLNDLALFVSRGQVDMDQYIDRSTKAPKGDSLKGVSYYQTVCANCHGKEGTKPGGMTPFGKQMGNPWEVMHKILNGHPAVEMPALRAFDRQVVVDTMAYMTTLPEE